MTRPETCIKYNECPINSYKIYEIGLPHTPQVDVVGIKES